MFKAIVKSTLGVLGVAAVGGIVALGCIYQPVITLIAVVVFCAAWLFTMFFLLFREG